MLIFQNEGLIDIQAVTTFGVSSKECNNPIGFFGTGLKYALAVITRLGGNVIIYRGTARHTFYSRTKTIRVNQFEVLHMDGKQLGFTTELGKTWEPWQAYRELACNTYDENGKIYRVEEDGVWAEKDYVKKGFTTIVVRCPELDEVYLDNDIFVTGEPLEESDDIKIYEGVSDYIYYRGVKAYSLNKPSLYTYNILGECDLTEDRTLKYSFEWAAYIQKYLTRHASKEMLQKVLSAKDSYLDYQFNFESLNSFSDNFLDVCGRNYNKRSGFNQAAIKVYMKMTRKDLSQKKIIIPKTSNLCLEKAIYFCNKIGYDVERYPIFVVDHLGQGIMGLAENGCIYLSNSIFLQGSKYVASTLIEEFIHLNEGFGDCTREMQTHLFDKIVTMGEQMLGEVL
jgi:hypothetical protein